MKLLKLAVLAIGSLAIYSSVMAPQVVMADEEHQLSARAREQLVRQVM